MSAAVDTPHSGAWVFVVWCQRQVNACRRDFGDRSPDVSSAMNDLDVAWELWEAGERERERGSA